MSPIRIYLVDDSSVVRRLVTVALAGHPGVRVAGSAANGRLALPQIAELRPDAVILDVEMPEMDGLQTLAEMRKMGLRMPVVMFSTETRRGAAATLDALALGASDYVTKPVRAGGLPQALEYVRTELLPKIESLCARRPAPGAPGAARAPGQSSAELSHAGLTPAGQPPAGLSSAGLSHAGLSHGGRSSAGLSAAGLSPANRPPAGLSSAGLSPAGLSSAGLSHAGLSAAGLPSAGLSAVMRRPGPARPVDVVAVGVSTGGPAALATFLPLLPADLQAAVTIVLHMPPTFTRLLAERLAAACAIPVVEASADEPVLPGHAYLAPGGYHMTVSRSRRIGLNQDPPENFCRPAVDVLFRSVAGAYGPGVLAVVLTGMGSDGTKGCGAVRDAGGQVLVQDQASSVVWGMPGSVAKAGLADEVLPLDQLAAAVARRVRAGRAAVTA